MNKFYQNYILKIIIFKARNMFESKKFKYIVKQISLISILIYLLIINANILSNFQKEQCTFDKKIIFFFVHSRGLSALNMLKKTFDLHQIFIIESLQVMEPIPKNMLKIQISEFPL